MTARTLVLLRHAKAETPGEKADFDRRLTTVGQSDADAAGAWLADEGLRPGLVLCSPAARTRQTWQGVAVALAQAGLDAPDSPEVHPEVRYEQGLYDGGRTEVIDLLKLVPEETKVVLVIGHNPTMSDISILLRPYDVSTSLAGLKTAGLAVHRLEVPWSQTEPGAMPLVMEHTARG